MIHRSLLIGPVLSGSFFAFCIAKNAGPGAFFLSLVLLAMLAIAQPTIQFGLMNWLRNPIRAWKAWMVSLTAIFTPIVLAVLMGSFDFF